MRIELHSRFLKRVEKLNRTDKDQLSDVLQSLEAGFGNPHSHAGLGIRRLRKDLFECRAGLRLRIVFYAERGVLSIYDVMTHDEIKAWLHSF